jgi:hypothetical protein
MACKEHNSYLEVETPNPQQVEEDPPQSHDRERGETNSTVPFPEIIIHDDIIKISSRKLQCSLLMTRFKS